MSTTRTELVGDDLVITTSFENSKHEIVEIVPAYGGFFTIAMMRRANKSAGFYFFERDTMRFFRSRVAPGTHHGRVFITSEQFDYQSPRKYTVRAIKDDGTTADLSGFQAFETLAQARSYVKRLYKVTAGV